MKRHFVFPIHFDSRALLLDEINPEWEPGIIEMYRMNQDKIIDSLKLEFGERGFDQKLQNFKDLGQKPFSIISHHNDFFDQCCNAFVHENYYPALVSACALGERIFNHVILDLRDQFLGRPTVKKYYGKSSFCDWDSAITILSDWDVFQHPDVESEYRKLAEIRHRSVHYNASTYFTLREDALLSIKTVSRIISLMFGFGAGQRWMIEGMLGAMFTKKEYENDPFLKYYYIPQSPLVGVNYSMQIFNDQHWLLFDYKEYPDRDISDGEFKNSFNERNHELLTPSIFPCAENIICYQLS